MVTDARSVAWARPQAGAGESRPLLHLDFASTPRGLAFVTVATAPSGQRVRTFAPGDARSAVWSPDGTRFAALAPSDRADGAVKVIDLQGRADVVFEAAPGEVMRGWAPAWSPDGRQLAVVLLKDPPNPGHLVAIVDVASRSVRARRPLPEGVLLPRHLSPPDALRWSANGRFLLVSWERAVVIELDTGRVVNVSEGPAVAEWAPNGEAVIFSELTGARPNRVLRGMYRTTIATGERVEVASAALGAAGLSLHEGMHHGLLVLSPTRTKVALVQGVAATDRSTLRIYDVAPDGSFNAAGGAARSFEIATDVVVKLERSPDERQVAALTIPRTATTSRGPFGKPAIKTLTLASGEWRPVTTIELDLQIQWPQSLELLLLEQGLSWAR
jgi:hypothetical protein